MALYSEQTGDCDFLTVFQNHVFLTITSYGTKVIILDKQYKEEELQKACR